MQQLAKMKPVLCNPRKILVITASYAPKTTRVEKSDDGQLDMTLGANG